MRLNRRRGVVPARKRKKRGPQPGGPRPSPLSNEEPAGAGCRRFTLVRHPSGQPPPHLAVREERAGSGRLLHADALRRALEFVFALLGAEEITPLLVLAARGAVAALHRRAADGVVRPPLGPAIATVHLPHPPPDRT